ncbi:MAG: DUF4186 family protein [Candidatus Nanohalobium sp.]
MRKLKLPEREEEGPRLTDTDVRVIDEIGIDGVKEHAREMVKDKLREQPENDGYQTPRAGNPVYKAMHACNASSRKELSRFHKIPAGGTMTETEINAVVNLLTRWIVREYNFYQEEHREKQKSLAEF